MVSVLQPLVSAEDGTAGVGLEGLHQVEAGTERTQWVRWKDILLRQHRVSPPSRNSFVDVNIGGSIVVSHLQGLIDSGLVSLLELFL